MMNKGHHLFTLLQRPAKSLLKTAWENLGAKIIATKVPIGLDAPRLFYQLVPNLFGADGPVRVKIRFRAHNARFSIREYQLVRTAHSARVVYIYNPDYICNTMFANTRVSRVS